MKRIMKFSVNGLTQTAPRPSLPPPPPGACVDVDVDVDVADVRRFLAAIDLINFVTLALLCVATATDQLIARSRNCNSSKLEIWVSSQWKIVGAMHRNRTNTIFRWTKGHSSLLSCRHGEIYCIAFIEDEILICDDRNCSVAHSGLESWFSWPKNCFSASSPFDYGRLWITIYANNSEIFHVYVLARKIYQYYLSTLVLHWIVSAHANKSLTVTLSFISWRI